MIEFSSINFPKKNKTKQNGLWYWWFYIDICNILYWPGDDDDSTIRFEIEIEIIIKRFIIVFIFYQLQLSHSSCWIHDLFVCVCVEMDFFKFFFPVPFILVLLKQVDICVFKCFIDDLEWMVRRERGILFW